jgi:hypothetical protein
MKLPAQQQARGAEASARYRWLTLPASAEHPFWTQPKVPMPMQTANMTAD